jgi:hypothetical protein
MQDFLKSSHLFHLEEKRIIGQPGDKKVGLSGNWAS